MIAISIQSFKKIKETNCFCIDKMDFIIQWWDSSFLQIMPAGAIFLKGCPSGTELYFKIFRAHGRYGF